MPKGQKLLVSNQLFIDAEMKCGVRYVGRRKRVELSKRLHLKSCAVCFASINKISECEIRFGGSRSATQIALSSNTASRDDVLRSILSESDSAQVISKVEYNSANEVDKVD